MASPRVLRGRRGAAARSDPAPNLHAEWAAWPHSLLASQLGPDLGEFCRNLFAPRLRLFEVSSHLHVHVGEGLAEPIQPRERQADGLRDLRLLRWRQFCPCIDRGHGVLFSIGSIVADNFVLAVRNIRRDLPDALLAKHLLDRSERKFVFWGRNSCPVQRNPRIFSFGRVLQGFRKNFKLGHEQ